MENRTSLFGIIALIIGASGLGLGAFSVVNFQILEGPEGPQGLPGEDGSDGFDGEDAPGGVIVKILDPDNREIISGEITLRAIVYGTENYSSSILLNGTEIGTQIPFILNTTTVSDGWWNITIKITDLTGINIEVTDEVVCYVQNKENTKPIVRITNPIHLDYVDGYVLIDALIIEDSAYNIEVLINGTLYSSLLPYLWNSSKVEDNWWNITIRVNDSNGNIGCDMILVNTINYITKQWSFFTNPLETYLIYSGFNSWGWLINGITLTLSIDYPKIATFLFQFTTVIQLAAPTYLYLAPDIDGNIISDVWWSPMTAISTQSLTVSWLITLPSGTHTIYMRAKYTDSGAGIAMTCPILTVTVVS